MTQARAIAADIGLLLLGRHYCYSRGLLHSPPSDFAHSPQIGRSATFCAAARRAADAAQSSRLHAGRHSTDDAPGQRLATPRASLLARRFLS